MENLTKPPWQFCNFYCHGKYLNFIAMEILHSLTRHFTFCFSSAFLNSFHVENIPLLPWQIILTYMAKKIIFIVILHSIIKNTSNNKVPLTILAAHPKITNGSSVPFSCVISYLMGTRGLQFLLTCRPAGPCGVPPWKKPAPEQRHHARMAGSSCRNRHDATGTVAPILHGCRPLLHRQTPGQLHALMPSQIIYQNKQR